MCRKVQSNCNEQHRNPPSQLPKLLRKLQRMVAVLSLTFDSLVVGVGLKVVVLRACRRQTGLAAALDGGRVDMPNAFSI